MDAELREAVSNSRAAVKSLQRQARLVLQLTTDLLERIDAALETTPPSPGGTAHERTQHPTPV